MKFRRGMTNIQSDVRRLVALHRIQLPLHNIQLSLENNCGDATDSHKGQCKFVSCIETPESAERSPILADLNNALPNDESGKRSEQYGTTVKVTDTFVYNGRVFSKKDVEGGAIIFLIAIGAVWYCIQYTRSGNL